MYLLRPIPEIVRVKAGSARYKQLVVRGHQRVFQDDLIQLVRIALLRFKHIHKPVAKRRALAQEQRSDHKRILPMGKVAFRLCFAAVLQELPPCKLAHVYAVASGVRIVFPLPAFD